MKKIILLFCVLFLTAVSASAKAMPDVKNFAQLPVQREGRITTMDSFARVFIRQLGIVTNDAPADWLAETIFNPDGAYEKPIFKITLPTLRRALSLTENDGHLYSFNDLTSAMAAQSGMMRGLLNADPKTVTDPAQQQLLALYQNLLVYFEISRSVSLLLPGFSVNDANLAAQIGVPANQAFSYLELMQHKAAYLKLAQSALKKMNSQHPTAGQEILLTIGFQLERMEADQRSAFLQIIPVPWQENKDLWLAPWIMFKAGQGAPQTAQLLGAWQQAAFAHHDNNQAAFDEAVSAIAQQTKNLADGAVRPFALQAEYIYNHAHLFALAAILYAASLFMAARKKLYRVAASALSAGLLLHLLGLLLRIFILARPPVGTLYESIVFVGAVTVLGALIFEARHRRGTGLLIGALSGCALLALAPLFAQGGDTMEPLVAVLNTSFWLATHVLMITAGYGCCLITGLLAHVYLFRKIQHGARCHAGRDNLNSLLRATTGAALIALCFTLIGTVLGGIWADQSWGRFWGWDPKENGALLIVLWLLFVLHGKLSGLLRADNFVLCAAASIIVVALSWFGVNLLNVGLHSYGFTSGIALYLSLFVGASLLVLAGCKLLLHRRTVA